MRSERAIRGHFLAGTMLIVATAIIVAGCSSSGSTDGGGSGFGGVFGDLALGG